LNYYLCSAVSTIDNILLDEIAFLIEDTDKIPQIFAQEMQALLSVIAQNVTFFTRYKTPLAPVLRMAQERIMAGSASSRAYRTADSHCRKGKTNGAAILVIKYAVNDNAFFGTREWRICLL